MWEYTMDPSINFWGIVQKSIAAPAQKEAALPSQSRPNSQGPPPPRSGRHTITTGQEEEV